MSIIKIEKNYYWHALNVKLVDNNCICNSNRIILGSKKPVLVTIPFPLVPGVAGIPIRVTSITVDTSCLQGPEIKLDFVISIAIPAGVTIANLTFQVYKLSNNMYQKKSVGPQWTYKKNFVSEGTDIFTFAVYDNDTFESDCCTYILEATPYNS